MKKLLVLNLLFVLGACANSNYPVRYQTTPETRNVTDQQYKKDRYECRRDAINAFQNNNSLDAGDLMRNFEIECMSSKGYALMPNQ